MRVDNPSPERLKAYFSVMHSRAVKCGRAESFASVRYLDLGTHVVRLICYSKDFMPHIEKQLTYVLRDNAPKYDTTLVVWREGQVETMARECELKADPQRFMRLRLQKLALGMESESIDPFLGVYDSAFSAWLPVLDINIWNNVVQGWDRNTNTYYYAAKDLRPEEFIKHGHIFVPTLNKILKSPTSALVHGAAIGLDNTGILFCARGQRGKSTLAVRAMLDGFDYVSDDYLVLGKEDSGLYAWPIYSIITLAPMMYGDLYPTLDVKFVSNNGRKDKYVFNIEGYHERFVARYPIKMGMFVQITDSPEPEIVECNPAGKGRAIVQLVHSTISQMGDTHDTTTIKKLVDFVVDLPFYQINLCRDIDKNLRCLRDFLHTRECGKQENTKGMLHSRSQPPAFFGG